MNTKGTNISLCAFSNTEGKRKEPQWLQNPDNIHIILLFSYQLFPDQDSTGAMGNPEGFLLQAFNRLRQLTQGKQSPEICSCDLLTPMSHSQLVFSMYLGLLTSCTQKGARRHCSCYQKYWLLPGSQGGEGQGWQTRMVKNYHSKKPCSWSLQIWGRHLKALILSYQQIGSKKYFFQVPICPSLLVP